MTSNEDKILIKILRQEKKKRYGTKILHAEFPNKHVWPLTTVKHLQQKIDDIGTVNRQLGSGRKQKDIFKQK